VIFDTSFAEVEFIYSRNRWNNK